MGFAIIRPTIGRKLAAAVGAAVLLSSCVTAGLALRQDVSRYVETRRESLLAAGHAFAGAASAAMAARDGDAVFVALRGIGGVPHLLHAAARDGNGRVLADIGFGAQLDADPVIGAEDASSAWSLLRSRTLGVVVPVVEAGRPVGSLELLSDAGDIWQGLLATLGASVAGCAFALAAGLSIAGWLQHSITRPLRNLTAVMARVRDRHDYALALPRAGDDEVGVMVAGFNAMLADIRERDTLLVRHRDRLEDDVRDRTRDLALAKEAAEHANAAKSTFLATMSHEIRTPMTGMLVMAELLASGDLPPQSQRYAAVIARSGQALLAIINDILDLSKIEAGKLAVERVPVDVREVVGTVVTLFHATAGEKALDLAVSVAAAVPRTFTADPVRLQQVVSNLVNNALKFTASGHVLVEVSPRAGAALAIAVSDTGIGIDADKVGTIFEAFTQAEGDTTRRFGGTGLGLSIASRLVAAMGGTLTVASEVGVGSTFTCVLPLADAVTPLPLPKLDPSAPRRAIVAMAGTASRQAFTRLLTEAGYDVHPVDPAAMPVDLIAAVLVVDGVVLERLADRSGIATVVALTDTGEGLGDRARTLADVVLKRPIVPGDVPGLLSRLVAGGGGVQRTEAPMVEEGRPTFPRARVLVVDDTAVNREVMVEALRPFAIVPDLAADGFEALDRVAAGRYDLVFMDGSMPGLDGFETCRRLRAAEAGTGRARTIVVALTAHVLGEAARAWQAAGMDGVLHKPFTLAQLEACLSRALSPSVAARAEPLPEAAAAKPLREGSEPLFDPKVLDRLGGAASPAAAGFAHRILGLYRAHAPEAMARLRDVAGAGAADDLAAAAHALRSMSVNIGARRVAVLADAMEAEARAGRVRADLVVPLDDALAATLADLPGPSAAGAVDDRPAPRRAG